MVDTVFDLCVFLLVFLAELVGMSYKAINVWIFVVVWPLFTLALIAAVIGQHLVIRRLRRQLGEAGRLLGGLGKGNLIDE